MEELERILLVFKGIFNIIFCILIGTVTILEGEMIGIVFWVCAVLIAIVTICGAKIEGERRTPSEKDHV